MTTSKFIRPLLAIVAIKLFWLGGCTKSFASRTFSYQKANVEIQTKLGPVIFHTEIADTPKKRAKGLMERTDLANDFGMLFVFEDSGRHTFWMKDTPTSLDIIFMDRSLRVVGVIHQTTPYSLRAIGVDADSFYALEVLAGTAKKFGIEEGQTVKITTDN